VSLAIACREIPVPDRPSEILFVRSYGGTYSGAFERLIVAAERPGLCLPGAIHFTFRQMPVH
jgi:hypothetical protein